MSLRRGTSAAGERLARFYGRHAGHRLEAMTATGNDYLPSGSAFDPMAIAYLEVSNGAETLLLQPSQCSDVDENLSHCQLDSATVETLIASCEGYFLPVELASLPRFVETHSDSGNVMPLVKRRAVVVEQRPQ